MSSLPRTVAATVATIGFAVTGCSTTEPVADSPDGDTTATVEDTASGQSTSDASDDGPTDEEIAAEIDRVVAEGREVGPDATNQEKVEAVVRCAEFTSRARYCLHFGWTNRTEAAVQADALSALEQESQVTVDTESTGDLSVTDLIAQVVALTPAEQAKSERLELEDAALGIDKVLGN